MLNEKIKTAYETLDTLGEKNNTFGMIKEGFNELIAENAELKAANAQLEADQISTLEAVAEMYEMMLGGTL